MRFIVTQRFEEEVGGISIKRLGMPADMECSVVRDLGATVVVLADCGQDIKDNHPYIRYVSDPFDLDRGCFGEHPLSGKVREKSARMGDSQLTRLLYRAQRRDLLQRIRADTAPLVRAYQSRVRSAMRRELPRIMAASGVLNLSTEAGDAFSGSNGSGLNGRGLSIGGYTWHTKVDSSSKPSSVEIQNNRAAKTGGHGSGLAWVSDADYGTGLQRTEMVFSTQSYNMGVGTRWTSDSAGANGYLAYVYGNWGLTYCFRVTGGTSWTHIGTASGTTAAGDTVGITSDGSNHTIDRNGSVVMSAVSDSSYANGVGWFYTEAETSGGGQDDFAWQVEAGAAIAKISGVPISDIHDVGGVTRAAMKSFGGVPEPS